MNETLVREVDGGFRQTITAGGHELTADELVSVGGTDVGPDPYGLLLSALGACTPMTLSMYANRKGWPVESISVQLGHSKVHAEDCEDGSRSRGETPGIRL
ncbi:OsmC family protein [Allorhodopirellula heiligendammensis]|uniref:OsmC-like protein n=1 Tax=Allorhodopirellula heiligendammensis TaxID=2714739 RepID=A0A5C6C009_9BACT|nr:OsmC family protein [Allorhodopirellula heiligendammensis]TWU17863.1 OsmC-like protein [Allorhodopirellula heiligendammensis]